MLEESVLLFICVHVTIYQLVLRLKYLKAGESQQQHSISSDMQLSEKSLSRKHKIKYFGNTTFTIKTTKIVRNIYFTIYEVPHLSTKSN